MIAVLSMTATAGIPPAFAAANAPPQTVLSAQLTVTPENRVPITLIFGRVELGQPTGRLTDSGQLTGFDAGEILGMLRPILLPENFERLKARQSADGFLSLSAFAAVGIETDYNPSELSFRVTIPYEMRSPAAISIAGRSAPNENARLIRPADVSAYVNVRAADDYRSRDGLSADQGRQPSVINLEGATEILGTTLESSATYRESATTPWQRGDARLIKDFPESRNRLTVGDLNYATTGFQSFRQSGGISISRNTSLQPYQVTSSTAERTFTLDQHSQVDVLVNGRRVRTLDLDPGRYNLRDLPLASGTNDVSIRIVDEVGRTQTINFPFVFDTNLLAPGEQEFSYALGATSRNTPGSKDYDENDPVLSASHVIGVTDSLTVGANIQAIQQHQVGGVEARVGTPLGIFRGDLSASNSDMAPNDVAARLQYRWTEPQTVDSMDRNILGNVTYRGKSFLPIGSIEASNPTSVDAAMSYGQRIWFDWTGSIGYSQLFDSGGSPEGRSLDLGASRRLTDSLFFDVFARRQERRDISDLSTFMLTLTWIPYQSHQRVTTQYDSFNEAIRADWSYTPSETIGNLQANVNTERNREQDRVRGDVSYVDYRFEAQIRDDESFGGESTSPRRTTGLRFGTALAFADGRFGITRPISDSFAMVVPHPSLAGTQLDVNRGAGAPQAEADALGPAILPRLPAYYMQRVVVDVDDLPDGYDLGDQIFNVQPRYRSGTLITVGSGATSFVQGILVDSDGRAIDLRLGSVASLDDSSREAKAFFTGPAGEFELTGLTPGRYALRLDAAPDVSVEFSVAADAVGAVSLGRLQFPTDQVK